jgi:inner membrane protein YidH
MSTHAEPSAVHADVSSKLALERTVLSHDRTMLSWVRTATSLITFGFSIQQFFRIARHGEIGGLVGPHTFGTAMIVTGLLALLLATLDHRSAIQSLKLQYPVKEDYPDIRRSRARILAALMALLGLLGLLSMLFRT